jgi:hypothetical protein
MKNRRYFTCPIQAIYMAKEFGVVYIAGDQAHYSYKDFLDHTFNHLKRRERFYVAEVSEAIFEPKIGDEGRWSRKQGAHYANFNGNQWVSAGIEPTEPTIMMRNNKHFFMGELENETQN